MELLKLNSDLSNLEEIALKTAEYLKKDLVGAIPTETFYGLAGNPFSEAVLKKIFSLKKRSPEKPIILLIGNLEQLNLVVEEVPDIAKKIIQKFWPGPITLVFKAKKELSYFLTAGTNTIGVRWSSSYIVQKICEKFGLPITGTSANISEMKPCRTLEEVLSQIHEVDFIVDGGVLNSRLPSTVISVTTEEPKLIREGVIPFEKVLEVITGKR